MVMKPKVLATSLDAGGINAIIPVISTLKEEGKVDVVVIGHSYSEKVLDNAKIEHRKISDYGLSDISAESMGKLLGCESPNLVFTGTSSSYKINPNFIEQTITLAAREAGCPSLAVLDVWGNYSARFNDNKTGEKHKFLPDKIAIMDKYAEQDMLREGFPKDRLVITGNPHFDDLESKARTFSREEKEQIRKQVGLDCQTLLFYAANALKQEKVRCGYWDLDSLQLMSEVLKELPYDVRAKSGIVAKLHPCASKEEVDEIAGSITKQSEGRIVLAGIPPQKLILASDFTLTPFSTAGIEAVYMGKPCISLQPGLKSEDYLAVLTKNRLVPVGYTRNDCKELVRRAFADTAYYGQKLVEQASSFRTDGKATARVTNLVYEMLAG